MLYLTLTEKQVLARQFIAGAAFSGNITAKANPKTRQNNTKIPDQLFQPEILFEICSEKNEKVC
jgi:hypothetical protein